MNQRRIILVSALIFIVTAWFSEGFYHWDEHFQITEFAGLKLGLTEKSSLPWEYECQMRPGIQPLIAFAVYKVASFAGINDPFFISFVLRLIAAAVSFLSIYLMVRLYNTKIDEKLRYAFLLLSFLLWLSVFNSVRFSSESFAGRIFIIGFAFILMKQKCRPVDYLMTGIILGLAFLVRYQVAFMIAGFAAWLLFIHKSGIRNIAYLGAGLFIAFLAGVVIDRWFYGEWVLTTWNYFDQNILLGKAAGFGTYPWWYYIEQTFMNALPPFSLVYITAIIVYAIYKPKDEITWTVLPFLVAHFIIGHKEIRFIFPVIGFLPVMIIMSAQIFLEKKGFEFAGRKVVRVFVKAFWYTNLILLGIVIFKPADDHISIYRKLYYNYTVPTILYYTEENPYHRVENINFYKRKNLVIKQVPSINAIDQNNDTTLLFATKEPGLTPVAGMRPLLIYSTYPEWIKKFDINSWVERTFFWHIYELKRSGP
jgi:GPI mannosyltransferase 3